MIVQGTPRRPDDASGSRASAQLERIEPRMPTYAYECRSCGSFDARRPMADADEPMACQQCGEQATRVFAAPAFAQASPLTRALDAQDRSAHAPDVVTSVPPARRRPRPSPDPRHARLPRP